jgi:iron complex outermembrane receptor protein
MAPSLIVGVFFFIVLLFPIKGFAEDANKKDVIEEVVVTGSLIKKSSFDSSSPLKILYGGNISDEATPALGEIFANQTFNYGSDIISGHYSPSNPEGALTGANIRGLGERATLVLVDGKRVFSNNLNNMLPQSVIERVDIVTDGASSLYGSDAIAGVINIITKKNFEGVDAGYFFVTDGNRDHDEYVANILIGASGDKGGFTFGLEYRERSPLAQTDRPEFLNKGFSASSTPSPGHFVVPGRDSLGNLDGTTSTLRDPGCGVAVSPGGDGFDRAGYKRNNISGTAVGPNVGGVCRFQFGEFFNFVNKQDVLSAYANFTYDFSDKLSYSGTFVRSQQRTLSRGSPSNPGGRQFEINEIFGGISGDHPGNPFQAITSEGNPVYAADVDGDGVPDRDSNGQVILATDALDSSQGIPFSEDVLVAAFRPFGKLGTLPSNFDETGANLGYGSFDITNYRTLHQFDYAFDSGWYATLSLNHQRQNYMNFRKNQSFRAVTLGLAGKLYDTNSKSYGYFNPFSTSALTCSLRICSEPNGPGTAAYAPMAGDYPNEQWVVDAIDINAIWHQKHRFTQLDLIASGPIVDLPAGSVDVAIGAEFMTTDSEFDFDDDGNNCNNFQGGCMADYSGSQAVSSAFFEFAVPIIDSETVGFIISQIAGRYSQYNTVGSSFDPKIALLWQYNTWLSGRASFSKAFAAPTIEQLFMPAENGLTFFNPIGLDPFFPENSEYQAKTSFPGNSNLSPERGEIQSVGMSLNFFNDSLELGLDLTNYNFKDRITTEDGGYGLLTSPAIAEDYQNFIAMYPNPTYNDKVNWFQQGGDPNIVRDSDNSYAVTEILYPTYNAGATEVSALDLYLEADVDLPKIFNTNIGSAQLRIDVTKMIEYSYSTRSGSTVVDIDAVGDQNALQNYVPSMPEYQAVGSLLWNFRTNQDLLIRARWKDSVESSFQWGFMKESDFSDSGVLVDLSYRLIFPQIGKLPGETEINIGARNIFDKMPDVIGGLGGIDPFVSDPRGRMVFVGLKQSL